MPPVASQTAVAEVMNDAFQVAPGFQLERVYQVPSSQGSWVSVTLDGGGNLLCADQRGEIYQVRVSSEVDGITVVEPLGLPLKGTHGLLWHKGVLWVSANEGPTEGGVWRVTDRNGDGVPDTPELVKAINGHGEHGPHSLVAAPDGNSIYIIAGNHTDLP
jgi:hypothetical protein